MILLYHMNVIIIVDYIGLYDEGGGRRARESGQERETRRPREWQSHASVRGAFRDGWKPKVRPGSTNRSLVATSENL